MYHAACAARAVRVGRRHRCIFRKRAAMCAVRYNWPSKGSPATMTQGGKALIAVVFVAFSGACLVALHYFPDAKRDWPKSVSPFDIQPHPVSNYAMIGAETLTPEVLDKLLNRKSHEQTDQNVIGRTNYSWCYKADLLHDCAVQASWGLDILEDLTVTGIRFDSDSVNEGILPISVYGVRVGQAEGEIRKILASQNIHRATIGDSAAGITLSVGDRWRILYRLEDRWWPRLLAFLHVTDRSVVAIELINYQSNLIQRPLY